MRNTAAPALLALALLAGAAGCGDDSGSAADPTVPSEPATSATPPGSPTEDPTAAPTKVPEAGARPFGAGNGPDDGGAGWGAGNGLGVTGVRTARQPGYDRVVFDLGGMGTPGWHVEYTNSPTADGSGETVPLEGTVFLQVVLRNIGIPFDTGVQPFGDFTTRVPGTGTLGVVEIAPGGGPFEGAQQAFIGLAGAERAFRVFALTNPARVVVDIRDS